MRGKLDVPVSVQGLGMTPHVEMRTFGGQQAITQCEPHRSVSWCVV